MTHRNPIGSTAYEYAVTLRALRANKGETQVDCAEKIGVSVRTVSNWEQVASSKLNARKMKRIYKAYGVTPQAAHTIADKHRDAISVTNPASNEKNPLPAHYNDQILGFSETGEAVKLLDCAHSALLGKPANRLFLQYLTSQAATPEQELI